MRHEQLTIAAFIQICRTLKNRLASDAASVRRSRASMPRVDAPRPSHSPVPLNPFCLWLAAAPARVAGSRPVWFIPPPFAPRLPFRYEPPAQELLGSSEAPPLPLGSHERGPSREVHSASRRAVSPCRANSVTYCTRKLLQSRGHSAASAAARQLSMCAQLSISCCCGVCKAQQLVRPRASTAYCKSWA